MRVQVTIPGLLRDCADGRMSFTIEAETIAHALQVIQRDYPLLRVHIWDDLGKLRQHVLIFHNDTALRWLPSLDAPLKEGDRLQIVQAISGGRGLRPTHRSQSNRFSTEATECTARHSRNQSDL